MSKKIVWSDLQKNIFQHVEGSSNILISAKAGAAKSTTIIESIKYLKNKSDCLFVAFNVDIVEDLKTKLPPGIEANTLHSLGMKILRNRYGTNLKVEKNKTFILTDKISKDWKNLQKDPIAYRFIVAKIVDLIRMNCVAFDDEQAITDLIWYYDIPFQENIIQHTLQTLEVIDNYNHQSLHGNQKKMIDYSDMIFLPTYLNMPCKKYRTVYIDEVQDLSKSQYLLVRKVIDPRLGRFIAVGDENQAIYAWRGADIQVFNQFKSTNNTTVLPLSVCYRCAKNIVIKAQSVYPDIQYWDQNIEGVVEEKGKIDDIKQGDWVLCRNNKPLFVLYYELLKRKKKAKIKGKDLGENLMVMVKKVIDKTPTQAITYFREELLNLISDLRKQKIHKPTKHNRYKTLLEKVQIIEILISHHTSMKSVYSHLQDMFTDQVTQDITLMTVFKSKGLENDNVFIIRPDLLLPDPDMQSWEKVQQNNLRYVAYTRAKKKLVIVTNTEFQDEEDFEIEENN